MANEHALTAPEEAALVWPEEAEDAAWTLATWLVDASEAQRAELMAKMTAAMSTPGEAGQRVWRIWATAKRLVETNALPVIPAAPRKVRA